MQAAVNESHVNLAHAQRLGHQRCVLVGQIRILASNRLEAGVWMMSRAVALRKIGSGCRLRVRVRSRRSARHNGRVSGRKGLSNVRTTGCSSLRAVEAKHADGEDGDVSSCSGSVTSVKEDLPGVRGRGGVACRFDDPLQGFVGYKGAASARGSSAASGSAQTCPVRGRRLVSTVCTRCGGKLWITEPVGHTSTQCPQPIQRSVRTASIPFSVRAAHHDSGGAYLHAFSAGDATFVFDS